MFLALRTIALTIALAFLSSCTEPAPDNHIDIVYDPCSRINVEPAADTSLDELAAIDEAIGFWNRVAMLKVVRDPTRVEGQPLEDQRLPIRFETASLIFRGVYQDEHGDVVINRRLEDPRQRAITVAHEFGHAFGLLHIDNRDSVMNSGNLSLLPLVEDVDALSQLWGSCVRDGGAP